MEPGDIIESINASPVRDRRDYINSAAQPDRRRNLPQPAPGRKSARRT
ncbi:MAG: hypothetical protein ACLU98_05735 [Desulfovibrio fairfieldensis]